MRVGDADEETDQEDHSVAARSKRLRAEVCWLGRQDIRAVMFPPAVEVLWAPSVDVILGRGDDLDVDGDGASVKSTSSHQSISVMFLTPQFKNHFLLPRGAKKWQLGCRRAISVIVGCER